MLSRHGLGLVFKSSFDKANRTSASGSPRGIGMAKGLLDPVFRASANAFRLPVVLTDVHEPEPVRADVADARRRTADSRPSCAARPTCCWLAACNRPKPVNVKKGQFLAPWDMQNVVDKLRGAGNAQVLVCERGTSFGYNRLVNDMRALPVLRETGCPVVFDATHSVQEPGGEGTRSGGRREFVPVLARAACAVGVAAVFMETHPDPDRAPSDGPNMVPMAGLPALLGTLVAFDRLAKERGS